jgi:hypothetical protein
VQAWLEMYNDNDLSSDLSLGGKRCCNSREKQLATFVKKFLQKTGSTARGDNHQSNDIDLLVDFEPGRSLIDLVRFERERKQADMSAWPIV